MAMKIIRYADQPDIPWANGLGFTRQLWADPAGERRISVARLNAAAPFSALPGMVRLLLVLDPIRITLNISGQQVQLSQGEMAKFSGEDSVGLVEIDRPGRVLNLMAPAGRYRPLLLAAIESEPFARAMLDDVSFCGMQLKRGDLAFHRDSIPRSIGVDFQPV